MMQAMVSRQIRVGNVAVPTALCNNNSISIVDITDHSIFTKPKSHGKIQREVSVHSGMTATTTDSAEDRTSSSFMTYFQVDDFDDLDGDQPEFSSSSSDGSLEKGKQVSIDEEALQQGLHNLHMTTTPTSISWRSSAPSNELRVQEEEKTEEKAEDPEQAMSQQAAMKSAPIVLVKRSHVDFGPILKRSFTSADIVGSFKNNSWKNLPKVDVTLLEKRVLSNSGRVLNPTKDLVSSNGKRSVRFAHIQVRSYKQCVGDNPSVSYGTPISLDWEYEEIIPIGVEDYESARGKRRGPRQMQLNYYHRRNILQYSYGVTEQELDKAERQANKIKSKRAITKAFLGVALVEDFFTSAGRKTKRLLGGKKDKTSLLSTSFSVEDAVLYNSRGSNEEDQPSASTRRALEAAVKVDVPIMNQEEETVSIIKQEEENEARIQAIDHTSNNEVSICSGAEYKCNDDGDCSVCTRISL